MVRILDVTEAYTRYFCKFTSKFSGQFFTGEIQIQFHAPITCPIGAAVENDIFAFCKVQWQHFSDVVDRFKNIYVEFL